MGHVQTINLVKMTCKHLILLESLGKVGTFAKNVSTLLLSIDTCTALPEILITYLKYLLNFKPFIDLMSWKENSRQSLEFGDQTDCKPLIGLIDKLT